MTTRCTFFEDCCDDAVLEVGGTVHTFFRCCCFCAADMVWLFFFFSVPLAVHCIAHPQLLPRRVRQKASYFRLLLRFRVSSTCCQLSSRPELNKQPRRSAFLCPPFRCTFFSDCCGDAVAEVSTCLLLFLLKKKKYICRSLSNYRNVYALSSVAILLSSAFPRSRHFPSRFRLLCANQAQV